MTSILVLVFLFALVALPISLIKPNLFARFYNSTRKKNAIMFGLLLLTSFVLIGLTAPKVEPTESVKGAESSPQPTAIVTSVPVDSNNESIKIAPSETPTQIPTLSPTIKQSLPTIIKASTATPTLYVYPTSVPTVENNQPIQQTGGFACNCSKTCTQISSCAEAQYQLINCGGVS